MADVFISYASEDRAWAQRIAAALEQRGWAVWWDRKIVAGDAFDETIERELDAAKCVVVLWSKHSAASEWVKNEAAAAVEHGTLVPALIDAVRLPLEFRRKQTVELADWSGEADHVGWQKLIDGIASKTSGGAPVHNAARAAGGSQPPPARRRAAWTLGLGLGLGGAALLGVVVVIVAMRKGDTPDADAANAPQSYAMTCRSGGPFDVVPDRGKGVRVGFAAGSGPAGASLQQGECSWSDRALNANEPRVLCDNTTGAAALVEALAKAATDVRLYAHFDAAGKCMRVVRFGP
jgi:hypothetical protein